jgi:hypothetical protein
VVELLFFGDLESREIAHTMACRWPPLSAIGDSLAPISRSNAGMSEEALRDLFERATELPAEE